MIRDHGGDVIVIVGDVANAEEDLHVPIGLIAPKILDREIQERSHFRRQVFPRRKDRIKSMVRETIRF